MRSVLPVTHLPFFAYTDAQLFKKEFEKYQEDMKSIIGSGEEDVDKELAKLSVKDKQEEKKEEKAAEPEKKD